ncbi:GNAT family N-acetyltransferase [Amycolatopsis keratiniphila]|uniref:GNAT family N-acetyltransferase n=1 Tax=Amycolatopsis keratiniphila TaxID=129921 RepID=UPI001FD9636D|nr:GNAT family N-acetyltransferase [Amycolatopsis keratiniphila]
MTAELESMRVAPDFRRRRTGTSLMERFLDWTAEHDADQVKVTAYAANDPAILFYENQGFSTFEVTLRRAATP